MLNDNQPDHTPYSRVRALLPYTSVALIIAALYVAWTFYSRYESNRKAQEAIQASKEDARKRVVDQIYGGGEIKFTTFGADCGVRTSGESTQLGHGVVNAKTVKLDPP